MTKHQHVLFLIPSLKYGGAERVFVTLLKHLDRDKFRISLGVLDTRRAAYLDEIPKDIALFDLKTPRVRYALPKLSWLIWKTRPDVVLSTLTDLNLLISVARPLLPEKTRYIARETGALLRATQTKQFSELRAWAYRKFCKRLDSIICQSLDMRHDLNANFAIPIDKLAVINNPIETEDVIQMASYPAEGLYDKDPNAIHLVAVGRLVAEKGFDLLIEAIALAGLKQLRVVILGDGPLQETLEAYAWSKGVQQQICFAGFQNNPYVFMSRADAFVLSSRYESFPNVVLEALACGVPVIATPAPGGVREIVRATGGVQLASAVSAEALCAELKRFVETRPVSANANLNQFLADKIVKDYERILLGSLSKG